MALTVLCAAFQPAWAKEAPAAHTEPAAASAPDAPALTVMPAAAHAPAAKIVKEFYMTLIDVMKQGDKLGFQGRYQKIDPAVKGTFNFALMTRMAVGPTWINATPDEQKQLIEAFSDFSAATYASRFTAYDGEHFTIEDSKPAAGGGVIVETKLQPKDSEAVSLNYLMREDDKGAWRVVDVFLNGTISELATRRAEFGAIVRRDGFTALVNSLGDKTRQMGPS